MLERGHNISLFSGAGLLDLAVERAGFNTIVTAESDPFCQEILKVRFPLANHLSDVSQVGRQTVTRFMRPLLVTGGFPCQDISSMGTAQGLKGARSGLWSEFGRVISELRPDLVFIENSPVLRRRGLDRVLSDLWRRGYRAEWDCVPAAAVGAPHLRDRVFILASPEPTPDYQGGTCKFVEVDPSNLPRCGFMRFGVVAERPARHTVRDAREAASFLYPTPTRSDGTGGPGTTSKRAGGKNLRTVVNELEGNGRLNPEWVEWLMGAPRGWSYPGLCNLELTPHPGWDTNDLRVPLTSPRRAENRAKRIQALGNAVVPQAAHVAFREMNSLLKGTT